MDKEQEFVLKKINDAIFNNKKNSIEMAYTEIKDVLENDHAIRDGLNSKFCDVEDDGKDE